MKALSTTLLLLGLCIGIAPSLRASVSFESGNGSACGSGNASLCFGGGSFTVTATAFSTTGASNTTLATATLGQYSYGLGVCNTNESALPSGCTSSNYEHAISNEVDTGVSPSVKNYDFVLLTFSQPVYSISLVLNPFLTSVDMDASYFSGDCTGACTTGSAGNLLTSVVGKVNSSGSNTLSSISGVSGVTAGQYTSVGTSSNQLQTVTITSSTPINFILIGASLNNYTGADSNADYFKLDSISSYTTTPEPATFGLAGGALLALGLLRRKKLLSAKS